METVVRREEVDTKGGRFYGVAWRCRLEVSVLVLAPAAGGCWDRLGVAEWLWINLLQVSLLKASSPNDWFL